MLPAPDYIHELYVASPAPGVGVIEVSAVEFTPITVKTKISGIAIAPSQIDTEEGVGQPHGHPAPSNGTEHEPTNTPMGSSTSR